MAAAAERAELDLSLIQQLLKTQRLGRCLVHRSTTASTMIVAGDEARSGTPHGTVVFAEHQTSARASVDTRTWEDSKSGGLLFTAVLRLDDNDTRKQCLPMIAAISMVAACKAVGVNAWSKWPNDLYILTKKAGGMIIRATDDKQANVQLVGVGINVNWAPADATSLRDVLERDACRELVLASFLNKFESLLSESEEDVFNEFVSVNRLVGCEVDVHPKKLEGGTVFRAKAVRHGRFGTLIVKREDRDTPEELSSEEVTIRPGPIPGTTALSHPPPNLADVLTGRWRNQLGSTMTLEAKAGGTITGIYITAVGGTRVEHPIAGRWAPMRLHEGAVLSYSVAWEHMTSPWRPRSATAWSGVLNFHPTTQTPTLSTTWLLTSETDAADTWKSVTTNHDTFSKL